MLPRKLNPGPKRKQRPTAASPGGSSYPNPSSGSPKTSHGVRDISIREKAYLYIQQLIANGTLTPGSGISELLLAKELGSSRTPIREAMNQLAAEGLLDQSPGGGMVVSRLKREDIVELYELREALEVFAAGMVARLPLRPAYKDRLQGLVDQISNLEKELAKSKRNKLDDAQMERFIQCDMGFHALLMSMTHNSRLQKIIGDTRLLISIFAIHRGGHDGASLKSIREYHQTILDAVAKQDVGAAMNALSQHIQASRLERLNEYDDWKRESSLRESMPVFFDVNKMGHQA
jgi:DNA-binding GntR family transcriptional regulator